MTLDEATPMELARHFLEATAGKNLADLSALFHDDAVFWTNVDQNEYDKASRLARIAVEFRVFQKFGFERPVINEFADGFVIRAVVTGCLADDVRFDFPICIVAETAGGRIQRLEEYLDPAKVTSILSAMEASAGQ